MIFTCKSFHFQPPLFPPLYLSWVCLIFKVSLSSFQRPTSSHPFPFLKHIILTFLSTLFSSSPSLWLLFSLSWSTACLSYKTAGERGRASQLWGERKTSTICHLVQRWAGGCPAHSLKQKARWEIHSLGKRSSWTEKPYSGGGSPCWQW